MAEAGRGPARWLAGLLSRRKAQPPPRHPGRPALLRGERALLETETLVAEALVGESEGQSARAAVAEAAGLALAGLRATAFVPGDALSDVQGTLEAAAARCTPLLVHAALPEMPRHGGGPGQSGPQALTDTGAFLVVPRDAQEALDFALVARRVAELGLAPGVVVCDGRETAAAVRPLDVPESGLIAEFLGSADDAIECPTPAQVLLFGDERRRVPRWFDPDRPVAHGVMPRGADLAAALAGRRRFFGDALAPIAAETMERLAALTGRPLSFLTRHRLEDARHVVVAQGAAVELAEAVADRLRAEGRRVGVLGVTWLRPFPDKEIVAALASAETLTVLERAVDALAGLPPLARELRACGAADDRILISGHHGLGGQALAVADLVAAFENAEAGEARRSRFWIGVAAPTGDDRFPKRQALLQRLHRDHPRLEESLLPSVGEPPDVRPAGARTVTLAAFRPEVAELGERLAAELAEAAGPEVLVRRLPAEPGCLRLVATAAQEPIRDPGDRVPSELALLLGVDAPVALDPLSELVDGGTLAIATELDAAGVWEALPEAWRRTVRERGLRVLRAGSDLDELLAALPGLLAGGDGGPGEPVPQVEPEPAEAVPVEFPLPLAVRRFSRIGETWDNVARFWGEVAQPRLDGGAATSVPDPYLAVGAVPSGTATFHDMSAERATVPIVTAEPCTGCGACWTACPDSSIAPTAVTVESLLRVAADQAAALVPGPPDPGRAQLQRVLPQLGARVESLLAKEGAGSLVPALVRRAQEWLAGKLELSEPDRRAFDGAFDAMLAQLCRAPLAVTQPFFHGAKAAGARPELLALAVNPQSCQGCGGCAEVCPVDAIAVTPQHPEHVARLGAAWREWELLPDTSGATVARASEEIGSLPALLLSRHVFFAVAGGDGAEPGSGERLALRHVTAVLEARGQQATLARAQQLESLTEELKAALKATLAGPFESADLAALERALGEGATGSRAGELGAGGLLDRLQDAGATGAVDASRARELVTAARELEDLRWRCLEGPSGVGRSRFGIVVAGAELADWAASFPRNPFSVPVAVDLAGSGPELAGGLLRGLLERGLAEERRVRSARLLLEDPPDRAERESVLRDSGWRDLLADEPGSGPALLVLGAPPSLLGEGAAGLSRLLSSELPVKLLLLDDGRADERAVDPVLLALAHRRAFVLSASVGHEQHLHDGLVEALSFPGPALVRIHAPSPLRDGFATERTVERAREAVRSRVQPLLRYDPRAEGVFGTRLSLAGNPEPAARWASDEAGRPFTPAEWALGAGRNPSGFGPATSKMLPVADWAELAPEQRAEHQPVVSVVPAGSVGEPEAARQTLAVPAGIARLVVDRSETWATLQELAGLVTPFTEVLRGRLEDELAAAHQAELEDLEDGRRRELASVQAEARARQASALTERLLRLAGYASEPAGGS